MAHDNPYLAAILERRWTIVAVVVGSVAVAAALTAWETPVYEASVDLVVTPAPGVEDTSDVLRSLETLERRTILATFARIASTRETRDAVEKRLPDVSLYRYRIRPSVVPYTNLIRIDVEGPAPETAANVAAAVAERMQEVGGSLFRIYDLRQFEAARASHRPIHPDWRRSLLLGALVGIILGLAAAFALHRRGNASSDTSTGA